MPQPICYQRSKLRAWRSIEFGSANLAAEALSMSQQATRALDVHVEVYNTPGLTPPQREQVVQKSIDVVAGKLSFSEAADLWDDHEGDGDWKFINPALAFKLAEIYYHTRDYERSREMLELVTIRYSKSEYSSSAREFLDRLRNRFKINPMSVGVLLPLTGRYQQYGQRSLQAIELALGDKSSIQLIVKDTAGDSTTTAKAVEDLVLDDHVIGIIGPLFSKSSMAAALKAEELSVPLLVLSYRDGLPQIGPQTFRTALTVRAQAAASLSFCPSHALGQTTPAQCDPEDPKRCSQPLWPDARRLLSAVANVGDPRLPPPSTRRDGSLHRPRARHR